MLWREVTIATDLILLIGLVFPTIVSQTEIQQKVQKELRENSPIPDNRAVDFGKLNEAGKIAIVVLILFGALLIFVICCTSWSAFKICRELRHRRRSQYSFPDVETHIARHSERSPHDTPSPLARSPALSTNVRPARTVGSTVRVTGRESYGAVRWI